MTAQTIMPAWMAQRIERDSAPVELDPDQGDSFALFLALDTQWQFHAMTGLRIGLDYSQVRPTAGMLDIEMTPRRFLDLRIMEHAALAAFARKERGRSR